LVGNDGLTVSLIGQQHHRQYLDLIRTNQIN